MNKLRELIARINGPGKIEVFSDKPLSGVEKDAALAKELLVNQSTGVETNVAQPVQSVDSRRRVVKATAAIEGTLDRRTGLSIPSGVSYERFLQFLDLTPNKLPTQEDVDTYFDNI